MKGLGFRVTIRGEFNGEEHGTFNGSLVQKLVPSSAHPCYSRLVQLSPSTATN